MNLGRRCWTSASTAFLIFLFATIPSFAQEGSTLNPADTTTGLIFRWINFLVVFGGAGYLIAKHSGDFFRANAKAIAAAILEATAAKAEAERQLREIEAKISRLDQEVAEMHEAARRSWAAEAERLYASGLAEMDKINQAEQAELAASERAARQQLREIAASMAVQRAAALVGARMNAEVRARMFRGFLGELGRGAN